MPRSSYISGVTRFKRPSRQSADPSWIPRQRQVPDLLANRRTNFEIATVVGVSLEGPRWRAALSLKWAGTAALVSVGVLGIVAAVAALLLWSTGDDEGPLPSASESLSTPVSASPTPKQVPDLAIEPWIWTGAGPGDWAWVRVFGSAVYVSSGPQYACCDDISKGPGKVTALDAATGNEIWAFSTPSQPFPVTVAGGHAFFGTSDGLVFAVDTATGREAWQHDFPGVPVQVVQTASALVVADGDPEQWGPYGIAAKNRLAGRVQGLDADTGKQRWEATVGNFTAFVLPTPEGLVVASSGYTGEDEVALFDANGNQKWRVTLTSTSSPPTVESGAVLVAGTNLYKLDLATGKLLWRVASGTGGTFFGPLVRGESVVAATNTHSIESRSFATGALSGSAPFTDCNFQPLGGSPFALVCGGLFRVDLAPQ